MFERHSALSPLIAKGGRDGANGGRALHLCELRGWGLAQLGVFADRETEFAAAVRPLIGTHLPATSNVASPGRARVYRTAPDQYWLVSYEPALAAQLSRVIPPAVGSVTPLSHARVRLAISGSPVRDCLAKGISIDLHPTVFPIGSVAQTGLHHTGILLERTGENRYELYVLRTFAVSIWEWLLDAALPFGYDVSTLEHNTTAIQL
jgi:sarcosine oxidase subunit gamma